MTWLFRDLNNAVKWFVMVKNLYIKPFFFTFVFYFYIFNLTTFTPLNSFDKIHHFADRFIFSYFFRS